MIPVRPRGDPVGPAWRRGGVTLGLPNAAAARRCGCLPSPRFAAGLPVRGTASDYGAERARATASILCGCTPRERQAAIAQFAPRIFSTPWGLVIVRGEKFNTSARDPTPHHIASVAKRTGLHNSVEITAHHEAGPGSSKSQRHLGVRAECPCPTTTRRAGNRSWVQRCGRAVGAARGKATPPRRKRGRRQPARHQHPSSVDANGAPQLPHRRRPSQPRNIPFLRPTESRHHRGR